MSSELNFWSTVDHEQDDAVRHHDGVPSAHPRGEGFRVLSRMARTRAELPDYSPRHRLGGESADTLPALG
jgi:hypothetical protein